MSIRGQSNLEFIDEVIKHDITFAPPPSKSLKEIGEFESRNISGTFLPLKTKDVLTLIKIANKYRMHLYPISTGKNWGFGSFVPVENECFVVDLSKMNRILKLNLESGIAYIEPGVTQVQLAEKLIDTPYLLNVTSSAETSSIIGNSLERGMGQFRHRMEDILEIEIILGEGRKVKWGGFSKTDITEVPFSGGVGPNLLSLAFQSNFGIVTSAAVALIPRTECSFLFEFKFKVEHFKKVHRIIREMFNEGILNKNVKIFQTKSNEFCLISALRGKKSIINVAKSLIVADLANFGAIEFYDAAESMDASHPLKKYIDLLNGIPRFLIGPTIEFTSESELDSSSDFGIRLITFVTPSASQSITEIFATALAHSQFSKDAYLNFVFNLSSGNSSFLHLYLSFKRNPEDTLIVKKRYSQLIRTFMDLGCLPYRLDIDLQNTDLLKPDHNETEIYLKLKRIFDPNGIIAPGRYQFGNI